MLFIEKEKKHIQEAGFTRVNQQRFFLLIKNVLQKKLGKLVYIMPIVTSYRNSYGIFKSITLTVKDGSLYKLIRFNYKVGATDSNKIVSIDFFLTNSRPNIPTVTYQLLEHNILQVLDVIVETIKNPVATLKNISESANSDKMLLEKLDKKEEDFILWVNNNKLSDDLLTSGKKLDLFVSYENYAKQKNLTLTSIPTFNNILKAYLSKKGLSNKYDRVRKVRSVKDVNILSSEVKDMINFVDKEMESGLGVSLEMLKGDIQVIARYLGKSNKNLLIVAGESGIGKTETVRKVARELNIPHAYTRLTVKNEGDFFKLLQSNNNKILIIDDSDMILKKSSNLLNMMLACTDSKVENRRLSYLNTFDPTIKSKNNPGGTYEQSFTFYGSLICITNLPLPAISPNLKTRAEISIVESDNESIVDEIKKTIYDYYPEIDIKHKEASVDFLLRYGGWEKLVVNLRSYQTVLNYMSTLSHSVAEALLVKKIKAGIL